MEEIKYPVRINKYLALKNICSRKEADILIAQKKVRINNSIAVLGAKVNEGDNVSVSNFTKDLIYLAFNKPKGVITHSPQKGETEIKEILKIRHKVFPVGRLDKDSSGLIILTNDGRITDKILNPEYSHEKEYIVKVSEPIDNHFIKRLATGVRLDDGYITKKCLVRKTGNNLFSIILTEGKNRQIRRMCSQLHRAVVELKRVRILNVELGALKPGEFRTLKGEELAKFLKAVGL